MNMKKLTCALIILSSPMCFAEEYVCTPTIQKGISGNAYEPTAEDTLIFDSDSMTYKTGAYDTSEHDSECTYVAQNEAWVECRTRISGTNVVLHIYFNLSVPNYEWAELAPNSIIRGVAHGWGECIKI
jgi:hypothetical protein